LVRGLFQRISYDVSQQQQATFPQAARTGAAHSTSPSSDHKNRFFLLIHIYFPFSHIRDMQ